MTESNRQEAQRRADERLRHPEPQKSNPNPETRPSAEELAGISEYEVRSASDGDPIGRVTRSEPGRAAPRQEPLAAAPDELGRRFLEHAAQTARNTRTETVPTEQSELHPGERNMLDAVEGEVETTDHLVTRLTLPSEQKQR